MAKTDHWPVIHAERRALATDLSGLSDQQWSTRTLCAEWTVQDLVAHMTATAHVTPGNFFPKLIRSGFKLTRMQAKDIEIEKGESPADTLSRFEGIADSKGHPPGPPETMLGEVLIHSEDIRRPLGIKHEYPVEAAVAVVDFYKGSNLIIGAKRRIAGVSLRATDTEWSHGSGPELSGPIVSLMMAMTGRAAGLDDLDGDGVAVLRSRA